jgi:ribosome recycling factor
MKVLMHALAASCDELRARTGNPPLVEQIKVKVYVNQGKSLSHIKIRHAYDFSLCFPRELLSF